MTVFPKIIQLIKDKQMDDVLVTGGGIIPESDMQALKKIGVGELFPPGTTTKDIVQYITDWGAPAPQFLNIFTMFQNLLIDYNGAIQHIIINRESKLNALNKETLAELHTAFYDALNNDKVVVSSLQVPDKKLSWQVLILLNFHLSIPQKVKSWLAMAIDWFLTKLKTEKNL